MATPLLSTKLYLPPPRPGIVHRDRLFVLLDEGLRTEGWAVGLQLAALALQGCPDPSGFIQAFSGGHRFVIDYLVGETLVRLGYRPPLSPGSEGRLSITANG